jgi:hemoglobin/transferrin/lactoferrin receptor protein
MKILMSTFMLCLLISVGAVAQSSGQDRISGTVKDQNGAVVEGASVSARAAGSQSAVTTITSSNGTFEFRGIRAGEHQLTVAATGFKTVTRSVNAGAETNITLEIGEARLTVSAEVGSATETKDVPQPVNIITQAALLQRAPSVIAQAAREEVGLNYQRTSPTLGAIVIRGLTGKNVVNYVDGVRYTHGGQRGGINTFFNLNDVSNFQSIEVVRGPNGAQYGSDSLAGTVNLVTKTPAYGFAQPEWHGELNSSFASADHSYGSSALASYGTRRFGGYLNVFGRRIGDIRTADGVDSHSAITRFLGLPSTILYDRNPGTGFKQYGAAMRLVFSPEDDQQFGFFYQRGQQDDGKRFDQMLGGDGNLIADLRNLMLDFGYVRYAKQRVGWFDGLSVTGSFNSQREERVNQGGQGNPFGDITHQYERTTTHGVSGYLDKFSKRNTFLVGGDFYHEKIKSPAYTQNGSTLAVTLSRPRVPDGATFTYGGIYVQDQWTAIPERLRITGALRYSAMSYRVDGSNAPIVGGRPLWISDELSNSGWAGRLGAVVNATEHIAFAFNYGRGFRYPSITDLGTLGLTGDGFEVDHIVSTELGGTIGSTAGADAVDTGIPVSKQRPEVSNNFDFGVRYNVSRVNTSFTVFRLDINEAIVKQALILPQGAVGQTLGSEVITNQLPNGVVFVAAASNPVLARANFSDAKTWGIEYEMAARLTNRLRLTGNYTYIRAEDKATGVPPNIEGGTPPPTAFLSLRHDWSRFWVEAYSTFAGRQDRFSSGDLADRRTAAPRSRAQIENFFRRGACVAGLTFNAAGTCNANVNTYTLRATGENITDVLNRVLGPGFPTRPLFTHLPGYGVANLRGGIRLNEDKATIFWAFENIFDQFYRNPSWGIDGTGRSLIAGLRLKF